MAQLCGEPHTNPFTWVDLDFNSMFHLMCNWYSINWANIRLEEHPHPYWGGNIYWLIVDNKVTIRYVHYLFDAHAKTPIVQGANVKYWLIWEYIVEKYFERVKRMQQLRQEPSFIIEWGHLDYNATNWARLTDGKLPFKVVVITRGHSIVGNDPNLLIIHDENRTALPFYFANKYYKECRRFITG